MRIGLIYPAKGTTGDIQPSLGLAYLASFVLWKKPSTVISVLDTSVATDREIESFVREKHDLVGISVTSWAYPEAIALSGRIKQFHPDTPVVLGGAYVTVMAAEALDDALVDYGVIAEGEETFLELVTAIEEHGSKPPRETLERIAGLVFRSDDRVVVNPRREFIKNLDKIPFPALELFPMKRYFGKYPMTTSRGCPYACVFCSSSLIWRRRWRMRSPENVVDEMESLIQRFGPRPIMFHDDAVNANLKRLNRMCDLILERKLRIPFTCRGMRVDVIDPPSAQKLAKAGCGVVAIGIESANPKMLERIGKNLTIEKISKGIRIFREAGIQVTGQFMIGNPGETLETVKESIDFARNSDLSYNWFFPAIPVPKTELWNYVEKHGRFLVEPDYTQFDKIYPKVIFETPEFSKQDRLEAIRLAAEAGMTLETPPDRKPPLRVRLRAVAARIWYCRVFPLLPRWISFRLNTLIRKIRAYV